MMLSMLDNQPSTNALSKAPLARGRTADVYTWGAGKVLKLYHNWFEEDNIRLEARITRAVVAAGVPAPAAGEIVQVEGRRGLIFERAEGMAMVDVLVRQPWRVVSLARQMADLHSQMHLQNLTIAIPSQRQRLEDKIRQANALPDDLRQTILARLSHLPDGSRVCHGDFHPGNILWVPSGQAVIIDWIDATMGNPLADTARTTILLSGAASRQIQNPLVRLLARLFHAVYLQRYFKWNPGSTAEYTRWLPVIAAARLSENIPELEGWLLAKARKVI